MKVFSSIIHAKLGTVNYTRNGLILAESRDEARAKLDQHIKTDHRLSRSDILSIGISEEVVIG